MAEVLVRDLAPEVVERLKEHARINGRSLQAELKHILEKEAARIPRDYRAELERFRKRLGDRRFSDSAELIREDREDPSR
jgi:antitoxin FitA